MDLHYQKLTEISSEADAAVEVKACYLKDAKFRCKYSTKPLLRDLPATRFSSSIALHHQQDMEGRRNNVCRFYPNRSLRSC